MAVAFVTGMQGDDPKYFKVVSTPKHTRCTAGRSPAPQIQRRCVAARSGGHIFAGVPRRRSRRAHAQSVMCAYNAIDGPPACANTMLLQDHLRDAWHFDGYVVSDCGAVGDVHTGHHYYARHGPRGGGRGEGRHRPGVRIRCQAYPALVDAVQQELITEAEIDTALHAAVSRAFQLGMFDPP